MCLQLLFLTSSPAIMGHGFVNSALTTGVTCCISLMVVSINAWAVYEAVISQVGRGQGGGRTYFLPMRRAHAPCLEAYMHVASAEASP